MRLKGQPEHPPEQPADIVSVRIDPLTGKRAATNDPVGTFEFFMKPYVPDEDKGTDQPPESTLGGAGATTTPGNGGVY